MATAPKYSPSAQVALPEAKPAETKAAPAAGPSSGGVDRASIARVVENVLAAQGIARGSGVPLSVPKSTLDPSPVAAVASAKKSASPASIAAEIADRFFGSSAKSKAQIAESCPARSSAASKPAEVQGTSVPQAAAAKKPEPPVRAAIEIQVFVSENDVRRAMTRSEKIFIGRKTILTPSARDLGMEHEVFVETESGSIR